eukprot:3938275-Rhodomonas_salina.1
MMMFRTRYLKDSGNFCDHGLPQLRTWHEGPYVMTDGWLLSYPGLEVCVGRRLDAGFALFPPNLVFYVASATGLHLSLRASRVSLDGATMVRGCGYHRPLNRIEETEQQ